jgi:hypothetical protein
VSERFQRIIVSPGVGRTLLSAAFDLALDFDVDFWILI